MSSDPTKLAPVAPGTLVTVVTPALMTEFLQVAAASGDRTMIDSAYPLVPEPREDITLIYAGGDTPHPWTPGQIKSMPSRWAMPCWVRSDPAGEPLAVQDAALFAAWLHARGVPMGTCVVIDLEEAIDAAYVNAFNLMMRAAGFKAIKYGALDFIFSNPRTDGGTFVANPTGVPHMITEGDTVATQWAFDGDRDYSLVKGNSIVPLWELHPDNPREGVLHVARANETLMGLSAMYSTTLAETLHLTALHRPSGFGPLETRYINQARFDADLPVGSFWWLTR